jgi:hypothetical protein
MKKQLKSVTMFTLAAITIMTATIGHAVLICDKTTQITESHTIHSTGSKLACQAAQSAAEDRCAALGGVVQGKVGEKIGLITCDVTILCGFGCHDGIEDPLTKLKP